MGNSSTNYLVLGVKIESDQLIQSVYGEFLKRSTCSIQDQHIDLNDDGNMKYCHQCGCDLEDLYEEKRTEFISKDSILFTSGIYDYDDWDPVMMGPQEFYNEYSKLDGFATLYEEYSEQLIIGIILYDDESNYHQHLKEFSFEKMELLKKEIGNALGHLGLEISLFNVRIEY